MAQRLIVAIGDVHLPYANEKCLEWIYGLVQELQPDLIVQVGDLYEFTFLSNYPKFMRESPETEWYRARLSAEQFWKRLIAAAPKAIRYQLQGNHESRLVKRLMEKLPAVQPLMNLEVPFQFPGVRSQLSENQEIILDDSLVLMHGYLSVPGQHALQNGMNTIKGHSHVGYVSYTKTKQKKWELDCGYVGDPKADCFKYRPQTRLSPWTNGVGLVLGDVPMFIPWRGK